MKDEMERKRIMLCVERREGMMIMHCDYGC
jgi:hypothetical protein